MTQINLLNNLIKQLMGKLDKIIEQNEKILSQTQENDKLSPYKLIPPTFPPHQDKPWNSPEPYTTNIICWSCGKDSGIPGVLGMVISPPGLACRCCGAIVASPNTVWCTADTKHSTNVYINGDTVVWPAKEDSTAGDKPE